MAKREEIENELIDEEANMNFAPLWEDEEESSLVKFIVPAIEIIILIIILVKVW